MFVRLFASDIRLIGLNDFSRPAERIIAAKRVRSFAQTMKQEPRGFVVRADHALQLQGAETFLARCHDLRRQTHVESECASAPLRFRP